MRRAALEHLTGEPALADLGQRHRYHRRVFLAPPWWEIYVSDPERRHGFEDAVAEYDRLHASAYWRARLRGRGPAEGRSCGARRISFSVR